MKKAPGSLKGELSRWLIEPDAGVFLGNPSARVRDKLWEKALAKIGKGYVLQVWSDGSCPQGYRCRQKGTSDREMTDIEGLALVCRKPKGGQNKPEKD